MLHGALSIHLHVSPSISMSPILLSTCLFSDCEPCIFYAAHVLLVLNAPRDGEGEGMGLISWAGLCFMAFTQTRSFLYAVSLLCVLHLSPSSPCFALAPARRRQRCWVHLLASRRPWMRSQTPLVNLLQGRHRHPPWNRHLPQVRDLICHYSDLATDLQDTLCFDCAAQ